MNSRISIPNAVAVLACAAAGWLGACGGRPGDAESHGGVGAGRDSSRIGFTLSDSQRARLTVFEVKTSSFLPQIEVTGNVAFNGDHSTQVISQISGPVARIIAQPGASVRAGDALAIVSSPDFAAAMADYRKAESSWRNAKRIADRDEQLFANDALARSDLDQARSDLAAAAADLDAATQQLHALGVADSVVSAVRDGRGGTAVEGAIRAPIDGTVVEKLVTPGQVLEGGATAAFTVADLRTMWVFANVFEGDLAAVAEGERAEIRTGAAQRPFAGRVDYVAALVDPASKATAVRIVATNSPPLLKKDMLVQVVIHGLRERQGILVPAAAVLRDVENLPYVFIVQADGSFGRRRVELGSHIGDQYEIRAGLQTGEKIVANGALFVDFAESQ